MEAVTNRLETINDVVTNWLAEAVELLPALAAAVFILIVGWIFALLMRGATRRLANNANRLLDRAFQRGALSNLRVSPGAAAMLGEVVFWIILFLAVAIAARVAGFAAVSGWLSDIATHLPNLIVGAAIIVIGYVVSVMVGEQVAAAARAANASQSALMGRLAQGAVFVTTLITGLAQIGVDVTFLIALFSVAIGAVCIGFSIAFGLGAREHVSDLIGARAARRELRAGQTVQIGDMLGEVVEITSTHIALDTARGKALVPARIAAALGVLIVAQQAAEEEGAS
jgi:hypothetical protein